MTARTERRKVILIPEEDLKEQVIALDYKRGFVESLLEDGNDKVADLLNGFVQLFQMLEKTYTDILETSKYVGDRIAIDPKKAVLYEYQRLALGGIEESLKPFFISLEMH